MIAQFATPTTPTDLVRADDLQAHLDDDRSFGAIRNGTLISNLTWNELTDDERQTARFHLFYSVYYC